MPEKGPKAGALTTHTNVMTCFLSHKSNRLGKLVHCVLDVLPPLLHIHGPMSGPVTIYCRLISASERSGWPLPPELGDGCSGRKH